VNEPVDSPASSDAARKARNGRNIALGLGLVAFVVMVFVVTLVRLGANVAHPHP
jgi:t-SNARE complex subunit (syntaxin)